MAGAAERIVLARRPSGPPVADDFRIEPATLPAIGDGELLLATRWISVDPMIAILIAEKPLGGAFPPLPIGTPIPGAAVSTVLDSRHGDFRPGDVVEGRTGWQDKAVIAATGVRKIDRDAQAAGLGILGLPGFTAWCGLNLVEPLQGKTVLISGAAGAVGGIVGQLAKHRGARVVGLAGSVEKCRYLMDELGFDIALNHREPGLAEQLATVPDGVDVYFDNVGGDLLATILPCLKRNATILVCGLMGSYARAAGTTFTAGDILNAVMAKSLRIIGFNNRDFLGDFARFEAEILPLVRAGELRERYAVEPGLEGVIAHVADLFTGDVIGKRVARLGSAD